MKRSLGSVVLLSLIAACHAGGGEDQPADTDTTTTDETVDTDVSADTDVGSDTDEVLDTDIANPWAGTYTGQFGLNFEQVPDQYQDGCAGTASLTVGTGMSQPLTMTFTCRWSGEFNNLPGDSDFTQTAEGHMDGEDAASGEFVWLGTSSLPWTASFSPGSTGAVTVSISGFGDAWGEFGAMDSLFYGVR